MEEQFDEFAQQELIHIHKTAFKGRKCFTKVTGIPEVFDYKKILKFWKNNFQTNGLIRKEGTETKDRRKDKNKDKVQVEKVEDINEVYREEIVVNGDHREKIKEFLIYMGISHSENIRVHGAN